jgi:hypothetical protein
MDMVIIYIVAAAAVVIMSRLEERLLSINMATLAIVALAAALITDLS